MINVICIQCGRIRFSGASGYVGPMCNCSSQPIFGVGHPVITNDDHLRASMLHRIKALEDTIRRLMEVLKAFGSIESDFRLWEARYGIEIPPEWNSAFSLMNTELNRLKQTNNLTTT